MKKKSIAAFLLAGCMLLTAGCSNGGKELSNKYVKISQYKGIEVEKVDTTEVTEDDVQNYIDSVLSEQTKEVTDRPAKEGDIVQFDYTGKLKETGEVFDEGSLSIGSGEAYVPGFEEGIYGHKLKETFDEELTFPEGYGGEEKPELSNAKVIFTITIQSIQERVDAELTDELVKTLSETSKTVEEYKKEIKKTLEESNRQTEEATLRENAWNALLENTEVIKYPEEKLEKKEKELDSQMKMILEQSYGVKFEEYLEQTGMTEEDYDKQITEMAKEYLKQSLVIELIAEKEGLELKEKEYDKAIEKFATDNGYPDKETLIETIGEDQVKDAILQNEVLNWTVKNCKLVEAKEEQSESRNDQEK